MKFKKWFLAFLVVMFTVITSLAIVACGDKNKPETDGSELGIYYYAADGDEYQLALTDGGRFTFLFSGEYKSGTYTLNGEDLVLVFTEPEEEQISATLNDEGIKFTYADAEMRFLRKISYTVTFNSNGGSSVESLSVINGKTIEKPEDPTKEGYKFIGWYTDDKFTEPFLFGSQAVGSDLTLYAYWGQEVFGQKEFTVDFDLGYETTFPESVQTIGGALYTLPVPEAREGYTFAGWWISMYDDAEKLARQYRTGMVLNENTTLYALWQSAEDASAPLVNVEENTIDWEGVQNAVSYKIEISGPSGFQNITDESGSTSYDKIDFSAAPAGEYIIKVTASSAAEELGTTVRYYKNKGLARVSFFTVVEPSALIFEGVEGAERYYISIDCGNKSHRHDKVALGRSTTYNFANCAMQEGGIKFVVTAEADGRVASVSEEFVYNRSLSKIEEFFFDEETETLSWNAVPDASGYVVSVKCGDSAHEHDKVYIGNSTSYCLKNCSPCERGIVVNVYPRTKGYNSPAASTYQYDKTILATPRNMKIAGDKLTWNAVTGADSYLVNIGGTEYPCPSAEFDLSTVIADDFGTDYSVSVRAVGGKGDSLWSDTLDIRYYAMYSTMDYSGGILSWRPVVGAESYEIQVNDGDIISVSDGSAFAEITLTKAGSNTVSVRFVDGSMKSEWVNTEIFAYAVVFDSRGGSGAETQYKAYGDPIQLPTSEKKGYKFAGWYNSPDGADANGAEYAEEICEEAGDLYLYAYWTPETYSAVYDSCGGNTVNPASDVVYGRDFVLEVPTHANGMYAFAGWYSDMNGAGTRLTDETGKSVTSWPYAEQTTVYACWKEVLKFVKTTSSNGGIVYAVEKGPGINFIKSVHIPEEYNNIPVAVIYSGAFNNCSTLESIEIPDTMEAIGSTADSDASGPFSGCTNLDAVNIYKTEGNHTARYQSIDGVLLDNNPNTSTLRIAYFPRTRTGMYRIPDGVQELPVKTFANSKISQVVIPSSMTAIREAAFYSCKNLTSIVFEEATSSENATLLIEAKAFQNCSALEEISFPKHLTELSVKNEGTTELDIFTGCNNLTAINVAEGNTRYSSIDGVLCTAEETGKTILYYPLGRSGSYTIPVGVTGVGAGAFTDRPLLTEVIIPNYVTSIGENAFSLCENLVSVVFRGSAAPTTMSIGDYAFYDLPVLKSVSFDPDSDVVSIGNYAFAYCTKLNEFTIPASMQEIGDYAFQSCTALVEVAFKEGDQSMTFGQYVFNDCLELTRVTLSAAVEMIPITVFDGCDNLEGVYVDAGNQYYTDIEGVLYNKDVTEILFYSKKKGNFTLPETVTTIGEGVFAGNAEITSFTIGENITYIKRNAFKDCLALTEVIFEDAGEELVVDEYAFANCTGILSLDLPDRWINIENYTFYNAMSLSEIIFGKELATIGEYAFASTVLHTVELPDTVTSVGAYAFDSSSALENVRLSAGMNSVGGFIFNNCPALTTVVIPSGITEIGESAFKGCEGLTKVTLPETLVTIGASAFMDCGNLSAIEIPKSVTLIEAGAFYNCVSLSSVTFEAGGTEDLVIADGTGNDSVFYATALTEIRLPARLTQVGAWSFYRADNLQSVVFEEENGVSRLQSINYLAFASLPQLSNIVLPNGLKTIGEAAFAIRLGTGTALKSISIPGSVTSIEKNAFEAQQGLEEVIFEAGTEDLIFGEAVFLDCVALDTLTLPARLVSMEKSQFLDNTSKASAAPTIEIEEGNKHFVVENGILYDSEKTTVLASFATGDVTIAEGVTTIPDFMFLYAEITSIKLPDSLTEIGQSAFRSSTLEKLYIPENVETIGQRCFESCLSLRNVEFAPNCALSEMDSNLFKATPIETITIPANVTILRTAFTDCTELTEVNFEAGSKLEIIYSKTFTGSAVTEIIFPEGLKSIQSSAFAESGIRSVTIPSSVTTIANQAFDKCADLEEVIFVAGGTEDLTIADGSKVSGTSTTITSAKGAFSNCTSLKSITLPARLVSIGKNAFVNCTSLAEVKFEEGSRLKEIDDLAFWGAGLEKIVLPASLEILGTGTSSNELSAVFRECKNLTSVTLSANMTSFNRFRFFGAMSLSEILVDENNKTFESIDGVLFSEDGKELIYYPMAKSDAAYEVPNGVEKIGDYAFFHYRKNATLYDCANNLTKIVIPASVKEIGAYAFNYSENLQDIEFAENTQLEIIGNYAFSNIAALNSVSIPASVQKIGNNAFQNDKNLQELSFAENGKLTEIGNNAFQTTGIKSVVLPDTVMSLGTTVFASCTSLTSVELSENLTEISDSLFKDCKLLSSVSIPKKVMTIGIYAFSGCSALESIVIPEGVTSIGNYAFQNCSNFKEVVIPKGMTAIGNYAFSGCSSLESISFANDFELTQIGSRAFASCTSLLEIVLPEGVAEVSEGLFYGAGSLQSVSIPNGVSAIGNNAFYGCASLEEITIPGSVLSIGNTAFQDCSNLSFVEIFSGLESFGSNVFKNCTSLTEIYILDTVTTIGSNAFATGGDVDLSLSEDNLSFNLIDGVLFDSSMKTLISFPSNRTGEYTVPDGVTTILDGVFTGSAITKITLPNSITSIGVNAFKDCKNLTEVVLPERLTFIGSYAFQNTKLKSVKIGRFVTEIGQYAFADCSELEEIIFVPNGSSALKLNDNAFQNCVSLKSVEIPYRVRNVQMYNDLGGINSVTYGIGSNCFDGCTSLASVTFEQVGAIFTERLSIGNEAFHNCSSLTAIDLPAHLQGFRYNLGGGSDICCYSLGTRCFSGCTKLASVTFTRGTGLGYIGDYAFENCVSLASIVLPENITITSSSPSAGTGMFSGCTSLKEVTLYGFRWNSGAIFEGCSAIETVNILNKGSSTYSLPANAFANCTALKNVNLDEGLSGIYGYAFEGCTALTELVLPESVKTIKDFAFKGCTGLTDFVLPDSVETLGEGVFDGWTAQQSITLPFQESELPAGWNEKWNSGCEAKISWISEEKIAA